MSGVHCHVCAPSTSVCAFVDFAAQYYIEYSGTDLYFKLDLQEEDFFELLAVQHKELTNEDLMEWEAQGRNILFKCVLQGKQERRAQEIESGGKI